MEDCSLTQDKRLTLYTKCNDFLTRILRQLLATIVILLRTSYFPYIQRRKMRIFGSSIVLGRHFVQLTKPEVLQNLRNVGWTARKPEINTAFWKMLVRSKSNGSLRRTMVLYIINNT